MKIKGEGFSIEYSGLDGLWKSIAVWGVVGIICAWISPVPFDIVVVVFVGGLAVAGLMAFWIYRLKTRWIEPTRWLGLMFMVWWALSKGSIGDVPGYLAVGSFFSVSIDIGLAIFVRIALKKVNEKLGLCIVSKT